MGLPEQIAEAEAARLQPQQARERFYTSVYEDRHTAKNAQLSKTSPHQVRYPFLPAVVAGMHARATMS